MRVKSEYKVDAKELLENPSDFKDYIKQKLSNNFGNYITKENPTLIKEIPEPIKENKIFSNNSPTTKFEIDVFIMKIETYKELGSYLKSIGVNDYYLKQIQSFFTDKY